MAQERPNRLMELVAVVRQGWPAIREHAADVFAHVRADPARVWDVSAVRYAVYALVGLIVTWMLVFVVGLLTPPAPPGAREPARTADFRIVCSDPACGYNFVLRREFGFDKFPVVCDRCKKPAGVPGRRCYSESCQGRWVAPVKTESGQHCPTCGRAFVENHD